MKPFAHWAIHKQMKIRIAGRRSPLIWGELVGHDGATRRFEYDQQTLRLTLGEGDDAQLIQLDDYGFEHATSRE